MPGGRRQTCPAVTVCSITPTPFTPGGTWPPWLTIWFSFPYLITPVFLLVIQWYSFNKRTKNSSENTDAIEQPIFIAPATEETSNVEDTGYDSRRRPPMRLSYIPLPAYDHYHMLYVPSTEPPSTTQLTSFMFRPTTYYSLRPCSFN